MRKKITLVAGGTGGHINAALAIGSEFKKNNYELVFISGQRYLDYQILKNENSPVYNLNSMALRFKDPVMIIKSLFINVVLFFRALFILQKQKPDFVIGTGGYICGPVILAAKALFIKTAIVEQNAVMGVTNRLLKIFSNRIFVNFENTKFLENSDKVFVSGNPIRSEIQWCHEEYEGKLKILVFGGSLGASQINQVIKSLIEDGCLSGVEILHQVGRGNIDLSIKMKSAIKYHQVEYIDNMQDAYAQANLIISRSGASTISELEIVKRAVILIPYAQASDNHQLHNANEYDKKKVNFTKVVNPLESADFIKKEVLDVIEFLKLNHTLDRKAECPSKNAREIIYNEMVRIW